MLSLLLLILSACGKLDCPGKFTGAACGEKYGPKCLSIDEYTSAGWDTCQDAQACGLAPPFTTLHCNAGAPLKP